MILLNAHWLYFSHVKKLYWKLIWCITFCTMWNIKKREFYWEGLLHEIGLIYVINQLAIYKSSQRVETETTWNKHRWWSEQDLNLESQGIKSSAVSTCSHYLLEFFCHLWVLKPLHLLYYQMNSTFLLQGLHMILPGNRNPNFTVVPAWLSLVDVCFVLMLIPIMDNIVYPWLDKKGWQLSVFKRISIGEYKFQL